MIELFKLGIDLTRESERKISKMMMFAYNVVLCIVFSFWFAEMFGFHYSGTKPTLQNIIHFFSSYEILIPVIIFISVFNIIKIPTDILIYILSKLIIYTAKKSLRKENEPYGMMVFWKVINYDSTRGKRFELLQGIINSFDEDSKLLYHASYLTNLFVLTSICLLFILPHPVPPTFLVISISLSVYWIANCGMLRAVENKIDYFKDFMLNEVKHF